MKYKFQILLFIVFLSAFGKLRGQSLSEEVLQLGEYIESSIENRNPYFINKAFDYERLLDNTIEQNHNLAELNAAVSEDFASIIDAGNTILEQTYEEGSYKLISHEITQKDAKLVFRIITPSGLDYHEYTIIERKNHLLIKDIYMFYDGTTISRGAQQVYNLAKSNFLGDKQSAKNSIYFREKLNQEAKFLKYLLQGNHAKLISKWNKLDDHYKQDEDLRLYALRASSYTDLEQMHQFLNEIGQSKHHQNQLSLIVLEGLFSQQEYQLTLNHIDLVDSAINTDPYLNFFRASVYKTMNDQDRSAWYLNKFINELPEEESGYLSLLELYLNNKQFSKATELLDQIMENFGVYKSDLLSIIEQYPGFIGSPEYSDWFNK